MSVLFILRSRVSLAFFTLGLALILAAACNGDDGGGTTPVAGETPVADETPDGGETPTDGGDNAEIQMLPRTTFDTDELIIDAGVDVTITADNTDGTHNFAAYTGDPGEGGELIAQTGICSAPCVDSVSVNLAAGEYFFRCEVHPAIMTGKLTVQ